jgi:hypothetical protein
MNNETQRLMTAFGHAIEEIGPTSKQALGAAMSILALAMMMRLGEQAQAAAKAGEPPIDDAGIAAAFSQRLNDLVRLTLAQTGGDA